MYNLYIDPFLLAYPPINSRLDEFENYIQALTTWGEEIDKLTEDNLVAAYISVKTPEILAYTNGYPEMKELEKTLINLNLQDVIHPHDIFILIGRFLKFPYIEDKFNINAILFDHVQCEPSFYLEQRNEIFTQIYYELAILIFLLCEIENSNNKHQIIITRSIKAEETQITVKGQIVDCEFCNNESCLNFPLEVNIFLQCFENSNSLYNYFDACDIWINASKCESLYKKAIHIFITQQNSKIQDSKPLIELTNWSFGSHFLKTAKALGFLDDPTKTNMLLRSCSETILKQNMNDTHWLRTGKGAKNPQKKRKKDNAKAWRRDIDYEYHLHYWETNNGIEFASIVVHNDMKIPD